MLEQTVLNQGNIADLLSLILIVNTLYLKSKESLQVSLKLRDFVFHSVVGVRSHGLQSKVLAVISCT